MKILRLLGVAVRYEINIWRSLAVWLLRMRTVPAGATGHSYAGAVTTLMIVFIMVSAIELPVLHLLLPWETVRLVADLLGLWGLLWMIGLLAALRVHPHIVDDDGIRIRYGFMVDVTVPWHAIASVRSRGRSVETAPGLLNIPVAKQTTVDIILREPLALDPRRTDGQPVSEVRLFADDPAALVAQVRQRLAGLAAPGT